MKKNQENLKPKNQPTYTQMKLLHWLTRLELSGGLSGDSASLACLPKQGGSGSTPNQI